MPVPKPRKNESEENYVNRCMSNETMVDEYDQKQRAAICHSTWRTNMNMTQEMDKLTKENVLELGVMVAKEIIKRKREGELHFMVNPSDDTESYIKFWNTLKGELEDEQIKALTTEAEKLIKDIDDYNPSDQTDSQLADDWRLLVAAYSTHLKGKKHEWSMDEIVNTGQEIAKEIVDRKKAGEMKYMASPEGGSEPYQKFWDDVKDGLTEEEIKWMTEKEANLAENDYGMYLVPNHAKMVYNKEKDLIIKSRDFENEVNKEMYLVGGDYAYGRIKLKEPQRINLEEFANLRDRHRITEEERKEWWKGDEMLYAYEFDFEAFERPRKVDVPQGVQTFIEDVRFLDDDEEGGTRSEAATKFWRENWQTMYPKDGEGEFVYQLHWRGLSEEEANEMSHKDLLEQGEHSVHGDLRGEVNNEKLWGYTVFEGDAKDIPEETSSKLLYMAEHKGEEKFEKLQGHWKLEIPHGWLDTGKDNPVISGPGEVGSTKKSYSKFFAMDWGDYKIGVWHSHYFELFLDGDELNGRCIIMYAPIAGSRKWLIDFPENQKPEAESTSLDKKVKELRESDTDHKWLIWNNPKEDKKPKKINIEEYKIEEESNREEMTEYDEIYSHPVVKSLIQENKKLRKSLNEISTQEILSENAIVQQLSEFKMPYEFNCIALKEGRHNGVFYPAEELKKSYKSLKGKKLTLRHGGEDVGKVTDVWYDESNKQIECEGIIENEEVARKVHKNEITGISVEVEVDYETNIQHGLTAKDLFFLAISFVSRPACDECRVTGTQTTK